MPDPENYGVAELNDGRVARLKLTSAGAAVLNRGRSRKNAYLARRLQLLEPDELQTLERAAELIERLIEDVEEAS